MVSGRNGLQVLVECEYYLFWVSQDMKKCSSPFLESSGCVAKVYSLQLKKDSFGLVYDKERAKLQRTLRSERQDYP